jgi:hypothetical protein
MLSVASAIPFLAASTDAKTPELRWADETVSPRLGTSTDVRNLPACPEIDRALDTVAGEIAAHRLVATDMDALTYALRAAGEPHVWPRAWMLEGKTIDPSEANRRMAAWLGGSEHRGHVRCGVARYEVSGSVTIAAVAVDAEADLKSVPVRARTSGWIDIDARVLVSTRGAKVVALAPTGMPRTLPTSYFEGRVRARASVDQPGPWLFQVVLDGDGGPRPALEALVFAGVEPPVFQPESASTDEDASVAGPPDAALDRMLAAARQSESLPPLKRASDLDRIARAHAERMMMTGKLAHDAGDGEPDERVDHAGIVAREIGENVAHAGNVTGAHRALWSSPSHRSNMLERRYDRVGIGVASAPDGTLWVTELFARFNP